MKHHLTHSQVSESLPLGILLAIVGGFLEAYTFLSRGGVFANCETGNLVLLALYLAQGEFRRAVIYIPPIAAFFCGVLLTNKIRCAAAPHPRLHWRQITILFEALCLVLVAFVPYGRYDIVVTTLISFVCSIQVPELPQNPRQHLCHHHVYRQSAQRCRQFVCRPVKKRCCCLQPCPAAFMRSGRFHAGRRAGNAVHQGAAGKIRTGVLSAAADRLLDDVFPSGLPG